MMKSLKIHLPPLVALAEADVDSLGLQEIARGIYLKDVSGNRDEFWHSWRSGSGGEPVIIFKIIMHICPA
ncbi:hypothetical protein RHMOL_Rhmol02G0047000 [Rhododendron molle]|uniref:Uncharacterized protein n=1 Tax=Rhododendron molle TaxID=49168 RepID=A0ACC0PM23_RHOML|nr:hypothetical protein RHMOL_Rhmol02G0047000 [Rhododendron molle]